MNLVITVLFWIVIITLTTSLYYTLFISIFRANHPRKFFSYLTVFGIISFLSLLFYYILNIELVPHLYFPSGFLLFILASYWFAFGNAFDPDQENCGKGDFIFFSIFVTILLSIGSLFFLNISVTILMWILWPMTLLSALFGIYVLISNETEVSIFLKLLWGIVFLLIAINTGLLAYYSNSNLNVTYKYSAFFTGTHFQFLNEFLLLLKSNWILKILTLLTFAWLLYLLLRLNYNQVSTVVSAVKEISKAPRKSVLKSKALNVKDLIDELSVALKQIVNIESEHLENLLINLKENVDSPLLVTVLGEFSSGKSTFINALIKENLLAMKIKPTTATITRLQYGAKRNIEVQFKDGTVSKPSFKDLHQLTVENFVKEENILNDIFCVKIELANELLKHLDIADTPGFNSNFERHSEITADFISYSDVVFWLFNANQLEKKTTFDLIDKHCQNYKPIGIINKIDLLEQELDEPIDPVINELKEKLKGITQTTFAVSAKNALKGIGKGKENGGMNDVSQYFNQEIIPNKSKTKNKMIFLKLFQIIVEIGNERTSVLNNLKLFEKKIQTFNKKIDSYQQKTENNSKSISNWESDSTNLSIEDMLNNLGRYFIGQTIPSKINSQRENLRQQKSLLIKEDKKLVTQSIALDKENVKLSKELNLLNNRWEKYNGSFLGLKRWLDDSISWGTKERNQLNRDSDKWDRKRVAWNKKVDSYNDSANKITKKFEYLNDNLIQFMNEEVLSELNEQAPKLNKMFEDIQKEENEISDSWKYYESLINDIAIFDNDIFEIYQALYRLFQESYESESEKIFKDFEKMVVHLKKYSIKDLSVPNKALYSRSKIDKVIHLYRVSELTSGIEREHIEKDNRTAPKII